MTALHCNALIVEDDELIAMMIGDMLTDMGVQVCGVVASADDAINMVETHRPDVVLMDVRLRGKIDGVEAAAEIYRKYGTPVIFLTGSSDPATIGRIRDDHAAAVLFKPFQPAQLRAAIEKNLVRPD